MFALIDLEVFPRIFAANTHTHSHSLSRVYCSSIHRHSSSSNDLLSMAKQLISIDYVLSSAAFVVRFHHTRNAVVCVFLDIVLTEMNNSNKNSAPIVFTFHIRLKQDIRKQWRRMNMAKFNSSTTVNEIT